MAEDGDVVLVESSNNVRTVTLNRPDKLNAFNGALFAGLADALTDASTDDSVRVVVLTGAGRAFSSGADLNDMAMAPTVSVGPTAHAADDDNPFLRLQDIAGRFSKPLIAAVNGLGVGLGFTILGYADVVFIAEDARLRTPFAQLGLAPEASSSYLFPLRMGWQEASRALLGGEWFDAERAVRSGLASEVTPPGEALARATDYARELASSPMQSLTAIKGLMLDAHREWIGRAQHAETSALGSLVGTPDNIAAVAAFMTRERSR